MKAFNLVSSCRPILFMLALGGFSLSLPRCLGANSGPSLPRTTLSDCTDASLRSAVAAGGYIRLACDGTISLTNTLLITQDTTLDASGHEVILSGGHALRVIHVTPKVALTLIHLTISEGRSTNGAAIFNDGGSVCLLNSTLMSNEVATAFLSSQPADGAGIYNRLGTVTATNCLLQANVGMGRGTNQMFTTAISPEARGGACFNQGGWISLRSCRFLDNAARGGSGAVNTCCIPPGQHGSGGAVYNDEAGTLTISQCAFLGNQAIGGAGGFEGQGLALVTGSGTAGGDGRGGGIFNLGSLSVVASLFSGNRARGGDSRAGTAGEAVMVGQGGTGGAGGAGGSSQGGALYNRGGLTLRSSTLAENRVSGGQAGAAGPGGEGGIGGTGGQGGDGGHALGGGIYHATGLGENPSPQGGFLWMTNCTISANVLVAGNAGPGGNAGNANRLSGSRGGNGGNGGNGGSTKGGAICVASGNGGAIISGTLAGNSLSAGTGAPGGGASCGRAACGQAGLPGDAGLAEGGATATPAERPLLVCNTILANSGGANNASGPITDGGSNLSSDITPLFVASSSSNGENPRLGPLQDNGGLTPTLALHPNSPAIDAGNGSTCPATDQRGISRIFGAGCDIGAYEFMPTFLFIRSVSLLDNQGALITGWGIPNALFELQAGTQLGEWQKVKEGTVDATGLFSILDEEGLDADTQFYRTVAP